MCKPLQDAIVLENLYYKLALCLTDEVAGIHSITYIHRTIHYKIHLKIFFFTVVPLWRIIEQMVSQNQHQVLYNEYDDLVAD